MFATPKTSASCRTMWARGKCLWNQPTNSHQWIDLRWREGTWLATSLRGHPKSCLPKTDPGQLTVLCASPSTLGSTIRSKQLSQESIIQHLLWGVHTRIPSGTVWFQRDTPGLWFGTESDQEFQWSFGLLQAQSVPTRAARCAFQHPKSVYQMLQHLHRRRTLSCKTYQPRNWTRCKRTSRSTQSQDRAPECKQLKLGPWIRTGPKWLN